MRFNKKSEFLVRAYSKGAVTKIVIKSHQLKMLKSADLTLHVFSKSAANRVRCEFITCIFLPLERQSIG